MGGGRRSAGSLAVVAGVLAGAVSGCGGDPGGAKALRSVHMGMSEKTVRAILGNPSSYNGGPDIHGICWYWSAHPGSSGNIVVNRYQVCFKNGKVVEKRLLD
jgi:hypothetical protein